MIFNGSLLKRINYIKIIFVFGAGIMWSNAQAQQIPLNQQVQNRLNELMLEADSSVFSVSAA
jgi:hypothetical protein